MTRLQTQVLIAGGGPVGLALAIELGWRGIACVLLERNPGTNPHPRANVVASRTMEHFRRWGIAEAVLRAGLPADHPVEVVFTTRLAHQEIFRFSFPSLARCSDPTPQDLAEVPDLRLSPYFKASVGQNQLEPVLLAAARSLPSVQVRFGWRLDGVQETADAVVARAVQDATGEAIEVEAAWLAGCDGGRSILRSHIGAELLGTPDLGRFVGIYFRAPGFDRLHPVGPATLYWALNRDAPGVFIAIDGSEHFTFQRSLAAGEEPEAIDPSATLEAALGRRFDHQVLSVQPWRAHAVVADRYRAGRIFLAGDAAHLFVPTGGFGMNTGIGDAVDLGWKLAAVLQGWAPPALLDSYELERRPIGVRNTREAADNYRKVLPAFEAAQAHERDGVLPPDVRQALAAGMAAGRKHFSATGIHLGQRYEGSPICVPDGTAPPPDDPQHCLPVARPGHRAPHAWLAPGRSTLDLFGAGFVLLQAGHAGRDAGFAEAAQHLRIPFQSIHLPQAGARAGYGDACVLVRPDGHVAWRGRQAPADPGAVLAVATGRAL